METSKCIPNKAEAKMKGARTRTAEAREVDVVEDDDDGVDDAVVLLPVEATVVILTFIPWPQCPAVPQAK